VDQVFREHPHQLLRDEHFAARRVNWLPKPDNLVSLAEELNLGLDSFVYVDDSDHECAAIRHQLPQVEVVQAPARPVDLPSCLDGVARWRCCRSPPRTAQDRAYAPGSASAANGPAWTGAAEISAVLSRRDEDAVGLNAATTSRG
jgi:predicted enzyme involved in methoxymalonyl-ACP biosynthesis